MKICYLANAQSVHTQKWVKFFADKGHEVHLISFERACVENVKVYGLRLFALRFGFDYPLKPVRAQIIKRLIGRINPDILHAHYFLDYGLYGALCGFKPFVVTSWGSDILIDPKKLMISKYAVKYVLRKADLITSDGECIKSSMMRLGVDGQKVIRINFGIDTRKFAPRSRNVNLRKQLGIEGFHSVISVRNLEPVYSVETLVEAMPLVLREVPKTQFLIVGKGSEEKRLRRLVENLNVIASVKFVGFIQNELLPDYLASVDVYVSTSLSDSGIASSTAEAMACGLPVIITDVCDNKEWVEDGENGFIVPGKDQKALAEKIIYLLRNEDVRRKFGVINRRIIKERNDYYKEMEKMEHVYEVLRRNKK